MNPVANPNGKYCYVPVIHKVTLGEIVDLLELFKAQPSTLLMPRMPGCRYEISSINFLKMVYKIAGWDEDSIYRITGTVYPENRLVEFEMGDAAVIVDEEFVDPEVGA